MHKLKQINMLKLSKILFIIFSCATIISVLSIYYTHQFPMYKTQTTTLCTYQHMGTYNYVAKLKPNIIYGNKTTLVPGEGALYTAIVKQINLTFTYVFSCNPKPENTTISHQITIQVESPRRWTKKLSDAEAKEMFKLSSGLNFSIQVNCTKIRELVDSIDRETGTRSSTYSIHIKLEIHITANVAKQKINETFTPELTIAFKSEAEKGNYIDIQNLNQTKPGAITETHQIFLPKVQTQRTTSYVATAITAIALIISAFLYVRYKPPTPPEKIIEKLKAPYKELIAETTQKPPETETTIEVGTIEDLAKIAEILAKPIFHVSFNKTNLFYVLDTDIKYQFKIKV